MVMTSGATFRNPPDSRETGNPGAVRATTPARQAAASFSSILACVDSSPHAAEVLTWANALARNLNASLRIFHVLDTSSNHAAPHDPVGWELRRLEAQSRLEALLAQAGFRETGTVGIEVAVGPFQERFQAFLSGCEVDLCVIGAVGEAARPDRVLGDTARRIAETAACSVLIVPPQESGAGGRDAVAPRRLMVPLDCSRRAETALPAAIALADAFGAELLMAHAVPEPAITESGPSEEADIAIREHVAEHNRKAAERYMSRIRARLALERRPHRILIRSGGDPRHQLVKAATDETVDMVVLAAKGAGGYADQSLGSVADFLVTHLRKPVLIVRPGAQGKTATLTHPAVTAGGQNSIRGRA